jgi:hypothetical protein
MNVQHENFINQALANHCKKYLVFIGNEWKEFTIEFSFYISSSIFPEETYSCKLIILDSLKSYKLCFNTYDSFSEDCFDDCSNLSCENNCLCPHRFFKSGYTYIVDNGKYSQLLIKSKDGKED